MDNWQFKWEIRLHLKLKCTWMTSPSLDCRTFKFDDTLIILIGTPTLLTSFNSQKSFVPISTWSVINQNNWKHLCMFFLCWDICNRTIHQPHLFCRIIVPITVWIIHRPCRQQFSQVRLCLRWKVVEVSGLFRAYGDLFLLLNICNPSML